MNVTTKGHLLNAHNVLRALKHRNNVFFSQPKYFRRKAQTQNKSEVVKHEKAEVLNISVRVYKMI